MLAFEKDMKLVWILGDFEIPGNANADEMGRTGTSSGTSIQYTEPELYVGLSMLLYKEFVKWKHRSHMQMNLSKVTDEDSFSFRSQEKLGVNSFCVCCIRLIVSVITEHCILKSHLFQC